MKLLYWLNRIRWSWRGQQYHLHYHSQNLNERRDYKFKLISRGPQWRNGRCWFEAVRDEPYQMVGPFAIEIGWRFFSRHIGLSITVSFNTRDTPNIQFHISIPLLASIYLTLSNPRWTWTPHVMKPNLIPAHESKSGNVEYDYNDMWAMERRANTGITWLQGSLWLDWMYDSTGYPGGGRHLYIDFDRLLHGKYLREEVDQEFFNDIEISMPEKTYIADVRIFLETRRRERLARPRQTILYEFKIRGDGIPYPGKGENDWDLEDERVRERCIQANNLREAVNNLIQSVCSDRARYGWGLSDHVKYAGSVSTWPNSAPV